MSLNPLAPVFSLQHRLFPTLTELLDNLKCMNPSLRRIGSGMSLLPEQPSPPNITLNLDVTTPRKQLPFSPQPIRQLPQAPLLQPSVLHNQQA